MQLPILLLTAAVLAQPAPSDGAIDAATVLSNARAAYTAAPGIMDTISYTVVLPGAGETSDAYDFALGAGKDMRINLGYASATSLAGALYITTDARPDAYFTQPITNDLFATLAQLVPEQSPPRLPQALLRWGATDDEVIASTGLGLAAPNGVESVSVVQSEDGRTLHELRLIAEGGVINARFDADTGFLVDMDLDVTIGNPDHEMSITAKAAFSPTVLDSAAEAVAFDAAERAKVETLSALLGRTLGVGDKLPEVALTTPDGATLHTNDLRGKVTVLEFWSTWCALCRVTLPAVDALATEAADDDWPVTIYAVNMLETKQDGWRDEAAAYWTKSGYAMPALYDMNDELATALGIESLPVTLVIDADGFIRAKHTRTTEGLADALRADIHEILSASE